MTILLQSDPSKRVIGGGHDFSNLDLNKPEDCLIGLFANVAQRRESSLFDLEICRKMCRELFRVEARHAQITIQADRYAVAFPIALSMLDRFFSSPIVQAGWLGYTDPGEQELVAPMLCYNIRLNFPLLANKDKITISKSE